MVIADVYFADEIIYLSEEVETAQELLLRSEPSVSKVVLHNNTGSTKYTTIKHGQASTIKTKEESDSEEVDDFR